MRRNAEQAGPLHTAPLSGAAGARACSAPRLTLLPSLLPSLTSRHAEADCSGATANVQDELVLVRGCPVTNNTVQELRSARVYLRSGEQRDSEKMGRTGGKGTGEVQTRGQGRQEMKSREIRKERRRIRSARGRVPRHRD